MTIIDTSGYRQGVFWYYYHHVISTFMSFWYFYFLNIKLLVVKHRQNEFYSCAILETLLCIHYACKNELLQEATTSTAKQTNIISSVWRFQRTSIRCFVRIELAVNNSVATQNWFTYICTQLFYYALINMLLELVIIPVKYNIEIVIHELTDR